MPRTNDPMTIRRAGIADLGALATLAALDSAPPPEEPMLIAESGGRVVAAVPFLGGPALADPFEPTAETVELLELRARQIREAGAGAMGRPGVLRRVRALLA
jgi:hypothetical protein